MNSIVLVSCTSCMSVRHMDLAAAGRYVGFLNRDLPRVAMSALGKKCGVQHQLHFREQWRKSCSGDFLLIRTMDSITDDGINGTTFPEFIRVLRFFLTQVRSRKSIAAVSIVVVTSDSERTSLPAGSRSHNLNKHLKQISGNNYI